MAKTLRIVSLPEIRTRLTEVRGAKFVTFAAATEPKMVQKSRTNAAVLNPFMDKDTKESFVVKLQLTNGQFNRNYDESVVRASMKEIQEKRRLNHLRLLSEEALREQAENNFDRGESWWTLHLVDDKPTPLARNKKSEPHELDYFAYYPIKQLGHQYVDLRSGALVSDEIMQPWLVARDFEEAGANQGIEDPARRIQVRVFKMEGLAILNLDGDTYWLDGYRAPRVNPHMGVLLENLGMVNR